MRAVLLATAQTTPLPCLALDVAAFAGAVALARIRYDQVPSLLRPLLRGIGVVVFVQVAFDSAALIYGPAAFVTGRNGLFFQGGAVLALASGALCLWRPSFLVPLFFH